MNDKENKGPEGPNFILPYARRLHDPRCVLHRFFYQCFRIDLQTHQTANYNPSKNRGFFRQFNALRSRRDSNPRYPFGVQLLSREPDSASLAPLQKTTTVRIPILQDFNNGAGGIRTPGTLRYNGFQDRLLQPLGHRSNYYNPTGTVNSKNFQNP